MVLQRTALTASVSFWKELVGTLLEAMLNNQNQRKCSQSSQSSIVKHCPCHQKAKRTRRFINAQPTRPKIEEIHMCSQHNSKLDTLQESGFWLEFQSSWTWRVCPTALPKRKIKNDFNYYIYDRISSPHPRF